MPDLLKPLSAPMSSFKTTLSSIPTNIVEKSESSLGRELLSVMVGFPLVVGGVVFVYKKIKNMKKCPFNFKSYKDQGTDPSE